MRAGVGDDVRHNTHRRLRRINIGIADHELFKDVVLNRAIELLLGNALLLTCNYEESEDGNDRAVHRHRHRHLVKRNAVEEDFHILNTINRNAGLANIADNAGMVTVIATVRCKIEGYRQALLPSGEITTIESVGFLSGRKTRILADRPWPSSIHGCAHAACERRKARKTRVS